MERPAHSTPPRLGTIADVAEHLSISTRQVRRYIDAGQLDTIRLGRRCVRVKWDSVVDLLGAQIGGAR